MLQTINILVFMKIFIVYVNCPSKNMTDMKNASSQSRYALATISFGTTSIC